MANVNGQVSLVIWLDSCLSCAFCYSKGICRSLVHNSINSKFRCFVHFQFYVFRSRIMLPLARTRRIQWKCPNLALATIEIFEWDDALTYAHLIGVILSFSEITFRFVSLSPLFRCSGAPRSSSPSHLPLLWCSLHLISFLRILFFSFRSAVCCT